MFKKKFSSYVFLCYLIAVALCSCNKKKEIFCDEAAKVELVQFDYPRKIEAKYRINNNFIDASEFVIFRKWGSDELKQYVMRQDTLTFSWNYNWGKMNDSIASDYFRYKFQDDSLLLNKPSLTTNDFGEVKGVLCEAIYKNKAKMIFYGMNASTGIEILAEYSTNPQNSTYKNDFFCVLKSITFK